MRTIKLLAWREVVERLRSKSFLVSTLLTLAIVAGLAVLPALLDDDGPTTYDVGVAGARADELAAALPVAASALDDVELDVRQVQPDEAEQLLTDGDLDAAVVDGEVLVDDELVDELGHLVQAAAGDVSSRAALVEAGVSSADADTVLRPEPLAVRALDPSDPEDETRDRLVFIGTMLLYGQLFGFGFWVASGLVEEKASRVGELLLTKGRSSDVLAGKVIGIGILGFVQLVGFVAVGLTAAVAAGSVDLPPGLGSAAVMVLVWFVLGFGFYSCLFAVGGALASSAEDLQTTTTPITMIVIASFFLAIAAGGDPGGVWATVGTYLPPSAPMVLPIRQAAGELPWYELVASVAIVLASTAVVIRLAARAYAGAALHVRGAMKLRDALRSAEAAP